MLLHDLMFDMQDARMEFNIDGAKVWDLTRNPTPKTVQKNVGFNPTSIGVGFNPTPKTVGKNNEIESAACHVPIILP